MVDCFTFWINRKTYFKSFVFFGAYLFIINVGKSQQREFIKTEDRFLTGMDVMVSIPSDNAKFIKVEYKDSSVTYTPHDIIAYGSRYGNVYMSREIDVNGIPTQVFLELLNQRKAALYLYRDKGIKRFFLERKRGTLVELVKNEQESFRSTLTEMLNDCEYVADGIKIVNYKKEQLSKLIYQYNSCKSKPFPYPKFGVNLGIGITDLVSSSDFGVALQGVIINAGYSILRETNLQPDATYTLGLNADLPILLSNTSLVTGIQYSKNDYSTTLKSTSIIQKVDIKLSSIDIPVLIRYTYPRMNLRPFGNLGVIFSKHVSNSNAVYETVLTAANPEEKNISKRSFISDNLFGLSTGFGVVRNLDYRKTVSIELRFNKFFGDERSLGKHQTNLTVGFTL